MIYNLISRLKEPTASPTEAEALLVHLQELARTKNTIFSIDTVENVLDKVFVMHDVHVQFFTRYHQHIGIDSSHNVNRYSNACFCNLLLQPVN